MSFIVVVLTRVLALPSGAYRAWRMRCAKREVARVLDLLGGRLIDSAVEERLVADYLANKPLAIHASQLAPQACPGPAS